MKTHPLLQIGEQVEREGLVVIDGITSMPRYGVPYISPHALIALCEQGCMKAEYDMMPIEFGKLDITFMRGGHIITAQETSADYQARMIVMSEDFVEKFKLINVPWHSAILKYYIEKPALHLTAAQFHQMVKAFDFLNTVSSLGNLYREEMMMNILHTIVMMRNEFSPIPERALEESNRRLASRFKDAVISHHQESHEVGFYAKMFNLSPKYFSTIIKSEIRVSAGEWIDIFLKLKAQSLLEQRQNFTIQQIAYLLGFAEQSSFSRFFKKQTGMYPTEYRDRNSQ